MSSFLPTPGKHSGSYRCTLNKALLSEGSLQGLQDSQQDALLAAGLVLTQAALEASPPRY